MPSPDVVLAAGKNGSRTVPRTPQLTSLLKADSKEEAKPGTSYSGTTLAESFTEAQLLETWGLFAEQRKKFQAEYQMLSQPYKFENNVIVVDLLSPVHESMLNNIKIELTAFLREQLKNTHIQVTGRLLAHNDKKIIYTNREKFDFLAEKNPMLLELKDRLGLDTDF